MSQRSASGASSHILHQQLFEPNRMSYQSQRIRARQDEQPTSVALKELGTAASSVVPGQLLNDCPSSSLAPVPTRQRCGWRLPP